MKRSSYMIAGGVLLCSAAALAGVSLVKGQGAERRAPADTTFSALPRSSGVGFSKSSSMTGWK